MDQTIFFLCNNYFNTCGTDAVVQLKSNFLFCNGKVTVKYMVPSVIKVIIFKIFIFLSRYRR